jgi:xanthine dehydrogenase molybdenum-binding subunit
VTADENMLRIGAMTALETIRCSSLVKASAPAICVLLASVASLQVRHLATIGGNIVWGAGDLIPLLIAHQAIITRRAERMPLESAWDGGLIEAVLLPARAPSWAYAEKVGFREAFSPSVVTVAASAHLVAGRFTGPILCIGGGPNTPHRLAQSETYLEGRRVADIDPESLRRMIRTEAQCADGAGLSAAHRARVVANLLVAAVVEAHV